MALPTLLSNQPQAGMISWSAFGLQYGGLPYDIPAGSTDKKFVWWDYQPVDAGEKRRNYASYPRGTTTSSTYVSTTLGSFSLISDMPGDVPTALRWTRTSTGNSRTFSLMPGTGRVPAPGANIVFKAVIRASEAVTLTGSARNNVTSTSGQVAMGSVTVPANTPTTVLFVGSMPASGTVGSTTGIVLSTSSGAVGVTIDITEMQLELGTEDPGPFFDGDTLDSGLTRTGWLGRAGLSGSYLATIGGPEQRRNLHWNPRGMSTVVNDWSYAAGGGSVALTNELTGGPSSDIPQWEKATYTASPNTSAIMATSATGTGAVPVLPSTAYSISASAITDIAVTGIGLYITWYNATGSTVGSSITTGASSHASGTWGRREAVLTSPSTAAYLRVSVIFQGSSGAAIGSYIGVTAVSIEKSATVRPYMDGSTGGDEGLQYMWLSTPFQSPSVAFTVVPQVLTGDVLPTLANEDCLLFLNKNGVGVLVPMTQVIEGSLIVSGSVLADAIGANQIDAWHLRANAITADAIAANAITSPAIAAGAITTEKLTVASVSDSYIANGSFEDLTQGWTVLQAGSGFNADVVSGVASSGANALRLQRGLQTGEEYDLEVGQDDDFLVPVSPAANRRWYVACRAGASATLFSGFSLRIYWYQADRVTMSVLDPVVDIAADVALATTWALFEGQVMAPADARYARVVLKSSSIGSTMYVDEVVMHMVTVAAMIGDGEIQTAHMSAGSVTADIIAANAIGAEAIAANSIAANHIAAGAIQTNHISPAVGGELDLSANKSLNLLAYEEFTQVVDDLGNAVTEVGIMATALSVTPTAVEITQTNSDFKLSLTSSSVSIYRGADEKSRWDETGLYATQFKGDSVILGLHQIQASPSGTIVKAL